MITQYPDLLQVRNLTGRLDELHRAYGDMYDDDEFDDVGLVVALEEATEMLDLFVKMVSSLLDVISELSPKTLYVEAVS